MLSAQSDQVPTAPGTYELRQPDGRRYTLVIPQGYTGREPVPLILSLHYGGNVTPFYGRGLVDTLVEPALRDLGAIIVAPDNVTKGWSNADAQRHVSELLDHVSSRYDIDSRRVLVTGYSMGGVGTWYLAPRLADRFTAAVVMAGRPQDDSTSLDWRTPLYVIHSRADELMALEPVEAAVDELRAKKAEVELVVIDGITHFQMARYQPHLRAALPWIQNAWAKK